MAAITRNVRNFDDFKMQLESDPDMQEQFREDPQKAIRQIQQQNPLQTDDWIYRIVVLSLGLTVILIIIGVFLLMYNGGMSGDKVPTIYTAIGSAAIGALAGLLAPSPRSPR